MKTKRIEIHTVMSWNNTWGKETIRAIALCDAYKWFDAAINCLRDGDMGEKDENGVYSRIWWADEAGSCCCIWRGGHHRGWRQQQQSAKRGVGGMTFGM